MDFNTIVGIIGLVMILLAFALNLFHKINQKSYNYNIMNLVGSGFLAYYAVVLGSIPFLILQVVWASLSLVKLIIVAFSKRK